MTQEHRRNSVSSITSAARMSVTGGAVPKNAKRSASLVRKATTAAAVSKKQGASLSKSATATMMHQMKSSLSSSSSMSSEKIVESNSPTASRQGSADSGIGKEEPIKEADDEKYNLPPRITTYSE